METDLKLGKGPEQEISGGPSSQVRGPGGTTPPTEQGASEQIRKLLGPLVSPLLRDGAGAVDLHLIPTKNFEEFRDFLITQVKVDGVAFNEHVFASYHKILAKGEYRPLLEGLFNEATGLKGLATGNLLERFTAEIISVSAQKFVSNHIQSDVGRQRIRSVLADKEAYTKEIRADVAKAVAQSGYQLGGSSSVFQEFNRHLAVMNYANIGIEEAEITRATALANTLLNQVEHIQTDAKQIQKRYGSDPGAVERFAGLERELNRKITDEEIQNKAKLLAQEGKNLNPVSQLKGKLAGFWLLVADEDNWKDSNIYKRSINAAFLINETERLLNEGENIRSEADFLKWTESIRDFLQGGLHVTGTGRRRDISNFFSSQTVAAMFAPLPQANRAAYEDLRQFVDEIHYTAEMGERIVIASEAKPALPISDIRAQFLAGLHQAKRSLWYGYKQHRALSRGVSNVASWFGNGDIKEIQRGQAGLDLLIKQVEQAKDAGQIKAAVDELQNQLKENGRIQLAMRASEMEGAEQMLGLGQTILILLASRGLLRVAGNVAQHTAQVATGDTLALRAGKAFGLGFYLSATENAVATASGEVRGKDDHLSHWFKDSTATAISMMFTAPLASYLGHPAVSPSILHRVAMNYGRGGVNILGRVGADLALETGEEWIDAFLRARMDDSNALIGKDQAREIAMVSGLGGGFVKMRVVGEILKPMEAANPPPEQMPAEQTPIAETHISDRPTVVFDSLSLGDLAKKARPAGEVLEEGDVITDDDVLADDDVVADDEVRAGPKPLGLPVAKAGPTDPNMQQRLSELEIKLAQAEGEKSGVQWRHDELVQKVKGLERDLKQITDDRDQEKLRADQILGNTGESDAKLQELEAQLTTEREEAAMAQQARQQQEAGWEAERTSVQGEVERLGGQLEEQRAQLSRLETEIEQLAGERDQKSAQVETSALRITELDRQITLLNGQLEQAQAEVAQLKLEGGQHQDTAQASIQDMEGQIESLQGELQGERDALASAQERILEQDALLALKEQTIQGFAEKQRAQLSRLETEREQLAGERDQKSAQAETSALRITELDRQITLLNGQLEQAQAEVAQLKLEGGQHQDTAQARIQDMEGHIESLQGELQGERDALASAQGRIREQSALLAAKEQTIQDLQKNQREELSRLETERGQLAGERDQKSAAAETSALRISELDDDIHRLKTEMEIIQDQLEQVKLRDRQNQASAATRLGELNEQIESLQGELLAEKDKQELAQGLVREKDAMLEGKNQEIEALEAKFLERVTGLNAKISQLESDYHSSNIERLQEKTRADDIEAQFAELGLQMDRVEAELKSKLDQLTGAEEQLQQAQLKWEEEKSKITRLTEEITRLQEKFDSADSQGKIKDATIKDLSLQVDGLTGQLDGLRQLKFESDLAGSKGELQLRETLQVMEKEKAELLQKLDAAQGALASLRTQLSDTQQQVRLSEERLARAQREYQTKMTAHQQMASRFTSLEAELRAMEGERDGAKAEVKSLTASETRLAERIRELTLKLQEKGAEPSPLTMAVTDHIQLVTLQTDLETTQRSLEAANRGMEQATNDWAVKEHDLSTQISQLRNILAVRGPVFFGDADPRLVKVEASAKARLTLTDQKGQVIGGAEIIGGGQEGVVAPMRALDGSIISAKTTKGVPKKHQGGNEDGIYLANFTVPLGKDFVEVKVLAGADGAGGEKRGDLATVFLQGVHAQAAEAAYQGRIPEAEELFEAGRRTVDAQHDFHGIPRDVHSQVTGAGAVVVIVGNQAMIATGGDSMVVFSRRQADGTFRSEGYSNADVIPMANSITRGIHLRAVVEDNEDGENSDTGKTRFKDSLPPNLYRVGEMGPGDRFTIGSDGFYNNIHHVFTAGVDFTASKEWQNAKGQRGYLLQENFTLLHLMLEAAAGRENAADNLHDYALSNMTNPGQVLSFRGREVPFPAKKKPDNIFVISYEQGQGQNGGFPIPNEYQTLEGIFETAPPPLLKYQSGNKADGILLTQRYSKEFNSLFGTKVGLMVAQSLANLYQNFPGLEAKFNPTLLAGAKDPKARNSLFDMLHREINSHPEILLGENKPFIHAVSADIEKIKQAAGPTEAGPAQGTQAIPEQNPRPVTEPPAQSVPPPPSEGVSRTEFNLERRIFPYALGNRDIRDPLLSNPHLEVIFNGSLWLVRDLGSEHGSWLNGQMIHKPNMENQRSRPPGEYFELKNASKLQVGNTHLRVNFGSDGNLKLSKIPPGESGFSPQGFSQDPILEGNVIRMNKARTLEIGRGGQRVGMHRVKDAPGQYLLVIESSGLLGRMFDSPKPLVRIVWHQKQYWLQNNGTDDAVIRSGDQETRVKSKEQALLKPGDWIKLGKHDLQFSPL